MAVAFRTQARVATPAICVDHAARLDGVEYKCVQALSGGIRYLPQPNTPDALPINGIRAESVEEIVAELDCVHHALVPAQVVR